MQIIGHRGWRGKFPENTLIGFEQAAELGVPAIELDIVITKDKKILVSHEPWFDLRYCKTNSEGNFYQQTLNEIQKIDCGLVFDKRFANQIKVPATKPSLKAVIDVYNMLGVKPFIALEVKSETKRYGLYQPYAQEFAELLIDFESSYLNGFDYFVQSFDAFFLKKYHQLQPKTKTGLLVEINAHIAKDLDFLEYKPDFYNPEHTLLTDTLVKDIEAQNLGIYTWTVNEPKDLEKIKHYPIKGLITDYPERFTEFF